MATVEELISSLRALIANLRERLDAGEPLSQEEYEAVLELIVTLRAKRLIP
jgi:hypothetical protein